MPHEGKAERRTAQKYSNAIGRGRLRQTAAETATCPNDHQRPRRREFASRGFAGERGAATDAATSPPASARWNRPQTVDLRQRPSATLVRRVHTEEIYSSSWQSRA